MDGAITRMDGWVAGRQAFALVFFYSSRAKILATTGRKWPAPDGRRGTIYMDLKTIITARSES
jgi:hypothetical protein